MLSVARRAHLRTGSWAVVRHSDTGSSVDVVPSDPIDILPSGENSRTDRAGAADASSLGGIVQKLAANRTPYSVGAPTDAAMLLKIPSYIMSVYGLWRWMLLAKADTDQRSLFGEKVIETFPLQ